MKKTIICLLMVIFHTINIFASDADVFLPGVVNVCFRVEAIGNTRGEFAIIVEDGLVQTPLNWFNEIAQEFQIVSLERKYWVKDQDWNLEGVYPMNIFRLKTAQESRAFEIINILSSQEDVLFAEPEIIYRTNYIPNDPLVINQEALNLIQAFDAWDIQRGSDEIIVGIIDTGVMWNHPDLIANMWVNPAEAVGVTINWDTGTFSGLDGIDNDENGYIDDVMGWSFFSTDSGDPYPPETPSNNSLQTGIGPNHGTRVAGVAAAVGDNGIGIAGIAHNVKILSTRHAPYDYPGNFVMKPNDAIYYMADLGVHIINCSFGIHRSNMPSPMINGFNTAVAYAKDKGTLIIAAAGNNNQDSAIDPAYPASCTDVISVAATNHNNDQKAGLSNFGPHVNISAPGTNITSTSFSYSYIDGLQVGYVSSVGTSFAAPIVAGVAALVKSMNPLMSVDELRHHTLIGADPIDHLNPGYEGKLGSGRVNALNSVLSAMGMFEKITTNTTLNPNNIELKKYIIDGAMLMIHDMTICPASNDDINKFLGFEVINNGSLYITNSTVDLGTGFIKASHGGMVYILSDSVVLFQDGKIELNNQSYMQVNASTVDLGTGFIKASHGGMVYILSDSVVLFQDGKIELNNQSYMEVNASTIDLGTDFAEDSYGSEVVISSESIVLVQEGKIELNRSSMAVDSSTLEMSNSLLILAGVSLVELNNQSNLILTDASTILGHTKGLHSHHLSNYEPGDRIIINSSTLDFSDDTLVTGGPIGDEQGQEIWDGFFFVNNSIHLKNKVRGNIENIQYLVLHNSFVELENAHITNSGQIDLFNYSRLHMKNSTYHDNTRGILVEQNSQILMDHSSIKGISTAALMIGNTDKRSFVLNSTINNNLHTGIVLSHGSIYIKNSTIQSNANHGMFSLSSISSLILDNSAFSNNLGSQIVARAHAFPQFYPNDPLLWPTVSDDRANPLSNQYLLDAIQSGSIPIDPPINCKNLNINTSDPSRFSPCISCFEFEPSLGPVLSAESLFNQAIDLFIIEEYEPAEEIFVEIILSYPESEYAIQSVAYLPYINQYIEGDFQELLWFFDSIDHDNLYDITMESVGLTMMFNEHYYEAIYVFDEIIKTHPGSVEGLVAEMNQAYCHYMLSEANVRSIPDIAVHKPVSYVEYSDLREQIIGRIMTLENEDETPETVPEIFTIDLQNYPNPFNPETMIHFTNPIAGNVTLEIYNIRGQKVKTLVNEDMIAGHHQTVWNGQNESNQSVASGIYLYRLQAGGEQIVRRMVLLK